MRHLFYDTCALINEYSKIFNTDDKIYISTITKKELEYIHSSRDKSEDIKYKARKALYALKNNKDKYTKIVYKKEWDKELETNPVLSNNDDSRIIISALKLKEELNIPLIFVTNDSFCEDIASEVGLDVLYDLEDSEEYKGYVEVQYKNDDELADLYEKIYNKNLNIFNLSINQYLFVKDKDNNIVDQYKYTKEGCERLQDFITFDSKMFGKVKPKDKYQLAIMDSLKSNKITVIKGAAGTGKSYLAMSYLFSKLERGDIDRIIIFCNTVAANGAAKLGLKIG